MVTIQQTQGGQGKYDENELNIEPLSVALQHDERYQPAKIGFVSNVYTGTKYKSDEEVEKLRMYFYIHVDDIDHLDDDQRDAITEAIEEKREEIEEVNERREEVGWDSIKQIPEEHIPLTMYATASITMGDGEYSNSKLYDTLYKLDLVEVADDDEDVKFHFLNREGDRVQPFGGPDDEDMDDEEAKAALEDYLNQNLLGMEAEIEVKNANQGKDNEYSTVRKVVKLLNDPEAGDE